jgi:hypothetical protein
MMTGAVPSVLELKAARSTSRQNPIVAKAWRRLHFPVVGLDQDGGVLGLRGNAFPISAGGDLLTCRHVAQTNNDEALAIMDIAEATLRVPQHIEFPSDEGLDLALLREAMPPNSPFFPMLSPGVPLLGEGIGAFGFYPLGPSKWEQGYLKGNVVAFRSDGYAQMTLSFAVLEGLSGSAVTTFHNGDKAVGICIGSEQRSVVASETLDYEDAEKKVVERIHRVVEVGLAYRVETIMDFCESHGIEVIVTDDRIEL